MPSLHLDPRNRSPYWYCAFTLGDGRRTLRSTGETDPKRAEIKCAAMCRIAEEESQGTASRDILEKIVNETLRRLGHDTISSPTVREFLENWLNSQRGAVMDSTLARYSQIVRDFLTHLGRRSSIKLSAITEADVISYRDSLLAGGRQPQTVNLIVRTILKLPFKIAVESGILSRNPVAMVKMLRGTSAHKGVFTPEQIAQLLSTVDSEWKGLILLGWFTGGRLGDLSRLKWSSVDLDERTISFRQGKTGGIVKIPLHPDLESWLLDSPQSSPFVFPTLSNRPINGNSGLSSRFTQLVKDAGIDGGFIRERKGKFGKNVSSLTFHSLRHSFNSALANRGVSQEIRQLLTGHASREINDKYTHRAMDSLRSAIATLPKLGS
jgi:integrase